MIHGNTCSIGCLASRIRAWWRCAGTPDPWPDDLDAAARAPDAVPVCPRCSTPCDLPAWFCPACGAAIGSYNNVMPYVYVFSVGEALRSGVGPDAHFTPFRAIAYALIGLAEFGVFAPVYLLRLYRNYRRQRDGRVEESGKASPTAPDSMPGTPDGAGRG